MTEFYCCNSQKSQNWYHGNKDLSNVKKKRPDKAPDISARQKKKAAEALSCNLLYKQVCTIANTNNELNCHSSKIILNYTGMSQGPKSHIKEELPTN